MRKFKVSTAGVGQRTDVFVASKFPQFARSALSNLFDSGLVKIAGKAVKAAHKLRLDEEIRIDDDLLKTQPHVVELPILYEDDDVVVMDKPAGILTHSKGALNTESSVASFLKTKITDEKLTSNRAGIVHRLDRPTSGVIIGAKTKEALDYLQKQFSTRKASKTYLAIVEGVPNPAEAMIDAPIGRNPKQPQTFKVTSDGKPAQTHYKILKKLKKNGKNYSELELKPITGRTHQLRVHLAYIDHPIVGDYVYGHEDKSMLLHASSLEIILPNGQKKVFEAPLPQSFKEFGI